jgi:hypothetical protein
LFNPHLPTGFQVVLERNANIANVFKRFRYFHMNTTTLKEDLIDLTVIMMATNYMGLLGHLRRSRLRALKKLIEIVKKKQDGK